MNNNKPIWESDLKLFVHGEESTHSCCNTRLDKERGKAKCCWCNPHTGCDFMKNMDREVSIGSSLRKSQ